MIVAFYSAASYAGKDTAAMFAVRCLRAQGYAAERDAFADDGKVVAADALGFPSQWPRALKIEWIDRLKHYGKITWELDEPGQATAYNAYPQSGRGFCIGLMGGSDGKLGVRSLDQQFWIRQVIKRDEEGDGAFTVVSDMRFTPEAEAVKAAGGVVIELFGRGKHFNEDRVPTRLIDRVISNSGTIAELEGAVRRVIEDVLTTHAP